MADQLKMALQDLLRKAELERDAMFCARASGCWLAQARTELWWPGTWALRGTSGRPIRRITRHEMRRAH
jgi:hypothetical protein